jgi:DedD protein
MKLPGKRGKDASRAPNAAAAGAQAQSEETLRIRARRRLIGAVVLVLTGVVVFPLIFETQPKPVVSNMSLVIPSQSQASIAPASAPRVPAVDARAAAAIAESSAEMASTPQHLKTPAPGSEAGATSSPPQETPAATPSAADKQAPARVQPAAAAPAKHQQTQRQIASARVALAALEGKQPDQISTQQAEAALAKSAEPVAAPNSTRYVIQAGAYADTRVAHQVRQKIEHAGFKTYTQVVDTAGGKRIRVRVGPFASRQEADKALARIKALGLAAVVLTL